VNSVAKTRHPGPESSGTAPLDWKEVWYTNCPVVSASNVDEALGWAREEFKKVGARYAFFRSNPLNDRYARENPL
jgi:hypothetical protein